MPVDRLSSLLDHTAFPAVADAALEARKLVLVRVGTGILLVWRCAFIALDARYFFPSTPVGGGQWPLEALAAWGQLLLAVGLAAGIAPVVCALLLFFTHAAFSIWTHTYNLAPTLLVPLLGGLAVLETGRFALWARTRPPLPAAYYRAVYLVLFLVYAALHFQAVLYHVNDESWIEGRTVAVLFTNSYLSVFFEFFRALERAIPTVFWLVSAVVVAIQTVFQAAMIPLALTRWGAAFVNLWGWGFIFCSLLDLRISVLPCVETFYWLAIFVPARSLFRGPASAAAEAPVPAPPRLRRYAGNCLVLGYGILLAAFFTNALLGFAGQPRLPRWVAHPVLYHTGLDAPNVFNRDDLSMGDRWTVIERLDGGGQQLVPFNGRQGERLGYHRSDLIYFGNSLRWRRGMIGVADLAAYHQPGGNGYAYARQIALFDHRRRGTAGPATYRVTLFRNRASAYQDGVSPARYTPVELLSFTLTVSDGDR